MDIFNGEIYLIIWLVVQCAHLEKWWSESQWEGWHPINDIPSMTGIYKSDGIIGIHQKFDGILENHKMINFGKINRKRVVYHLIIHHELYIPWYNSPLGAIGIFFFSTRHMLWRRLRPAPDKSLPGPEARPSQASLTRCCVRFDRIPRDPSRSAALKVALELGLPIAAHALPCESLPRCWSQVSVTHVHRCDDVSSLGSFGPCL